MTIEEIKSSTKEVLTPADIADVLNADPQDIRVAARTAPEKLGFPVIVIKSRIKVPRVPFLKYFGINV